MTAARASRARRSLDAAAVKAAVDLVSLVERHLPLKRAGRNMVGLCPFHAEKTPSFTVSPATQRYKCFGCGRKGDVFSFLMEREGLEFRAAVERLAAEVGVSTPRSVPVAARTVQLAPPPPDLSAVVEAAVMATPADWYAQQAAALGLPEGDGIAALRRLRAHQAHYDVVRILAASPRDAAPAAELRGQCDRLRTGVWVGYPMLAAGRIVGIRLRRTSTRDKRALLGSREGLFVPDALPSTERLAIVEGPTDCAALLAVGIAAIGRPSCTGGVEHVRGLVRALQPPSAVVVADRDEPGQRGARDLATLLALHVVDVRMVTPPAPHKDARGWIADGAQRGEVEALIAATPRLVLRVRAEDGR